jgi:PD-(D/E)XK endonuclease
MFVLTTNQKGAVAEAAIAAEALKAGIHVLKPIAEHQRYDLAFDLGRRIVRVQCKWAQLRGDVVIVHLSSCRHTPRGYVYTTYSADEIDAIAAYCGDLDRSYLFPIELVAGRRAIQLRLAPPRNAQRAALNWACDHELGAIAQSEERLRGTQEVAGSSPASSISGCLLNLRALASA